MHDFVFNGQRLSDFGACIVELPHYSIAMRDLSFNSVLGRSGDIITDNNRYKNVELSYKISSIPNNRMTAQGFIYRLTQWLVSSHEYGILKDTYNTGYFRKAVVTSIETPTATLGGIVSTSVTFNCEPFLYNDTGAEKLIYTTTAGTITANLHNPEQWSSAPIIRIIGSGDYSVAVSNQTSFSISSVIDEITIDKMNEDVYDKNGKSCNDKITCLKLPEFLPGNSNVTISSTSNSTFTVEITPNWRRL